MNEETTVAVTPEATQATDTQEAQALDPQALAKELEKTRREAAKYRTQLREREEAEKQARTLAEQEALKAKPLEERLKALESERQTLAQSLEQKEAELAVRELRGQLRDAGVPKETLDDALDLYLAAVDRAPEGEEPELADFLKSRPYLVPTTKAPPTLPGAPSGVGAGKSPSLAQQAEQAREAGNIALYIALSEKARKEANA
jgi:flagellar biosynthesis GTPase FlhF